MSLAGPEHDLNCTLLTCLLVYCAWNFGKSTVVVVDMQSGAFSSSVPSPLLLWLYSSLRCCKLRSAAINKTFQASKTRGAFGPLDAKSLVNAFIRDIGSIELERYVVRLYCIDLQIQEIHKGCVWVHERHQIYWVGTDIHWEHTQDVVLLTQMRGVQYDSDKAWSW